MNTYVVAGSKPWNREVFDESISRYQGRWVFISERDQLSEDHIAKLNPRFVFFLHWSWKVEPSIVENYECVCFHITDLPFGRGGSPLQNLIARGLRTTVVTAFRMTDELDAGPVYLKQPMSLKGTAQEIYIRATNIAGDMIARIVAEEPDPKPQAGEVITFSRRTPADSEITAAIGDLEQLHDHIRMLDADGYPRACVRIGDFVLTFRNSALDNGRLRADVEIMVDATEER